MTTVGNDRSAYGFPITYVGNNAEEPFLFTTMPKNLHLLNPHRVFVLWFRHIRYLFR